MALTRMFQRPTSTAKDLVRPITPHLAAAIRGAKGQAEKAGGRGDVDDAARALILHQRHGAAAGQELRIEADGQALAPALEIHVLDGGGRAGDAGIVDEDVEAIDGVHRIVEPGVDRILVADIDRRGDDLGIVVIEPGQRLFVDVARMDTVPFIGEGAGDGGTDAGSGSRDHHPQLAHRAPFDRCRRTPMQKVCAAWPASAWAGA